MKTIHKHLVLGAGVTKFTTYVGGKVLSAGLDPRSVDQLVVWIELETSRGIQEYQIGVYGTGWDLSEENVGRFINTVIDNTGFVWHVYDQTKT